MNVSVKNFRLKMSSIHIDLDIKKSLKADI